MESNNQINELIGRFLTNNLSEEEHSTIVEWINANEENRRYFINYMNTWQLTSVKLTAQVNEDEEWDLFKQTVAARDANLISINENTLSEDAFTGKAQERKAVIYRKMTRVATAAAVLLAIGLGWIYFSKKDQPPAVVTNTAAKDTVATLVQREVNTSGKEKSITLADGSMIVLFNNSEVIYEAPFNKRHIRLTGKAFFKVAKDTTRPFTVESGAIATTALGTEFTVSAFAKERQLSVRLYDGKVVIKAVDKTTSLIKHDVFLMPGQEFIYGPYSTAIRTFRADSQKPNMRKNSSAAVDNPSLPVNAKGSWHMYNNQPLSQVLDHLAATYKVMIVYEAKDVQQKYFVGQFKTTDSIEVILKLITKANKLKYTREDSTYIIHQ
ncbi:FecR family protein [Longitalea luteola]|uniref:FecR family protein n=1 Tax=Longitalea luteola TaxID=2812563 RepID=UPI001A95951F|nr:FecR family protein [Longitalea luteola]